MTERSFDDGFWGDKFVQDQERDGKILFAYLFTNRRCNPAGLYEITLKTIAFETGIDLDALPALLDGLQPKVEWYREHGLVWVKNFVRRQSRSPKFLVAVANCLSQIKDMSIVQTLLDYNDTLSIPYRYPTDTISIPSEERPCKGHREAEADRVPIPYGKGIGTLTGTGAGADTDRGGDGGGDAEHHSIFDLYEQNIGVLSPIMTKTLEEAGAQYPPEWIADAFREAAEHNARTWKYVERILKRWRSEGRGEKVKAQQEHDGPRAEYLN